ncbi:hypothetical protein CO112_00310 [Candidatus Dojkabacteria bacterium CG_4_9_14_3_um_filter_150_Dojkabacteria_WS6_41_13]|uniref:Uncharacterized protein n=1 Tax=Candidatus Dojkabacteria bacterium CG_4_10_14_0_2_um_filter_Dojkabacteria_WS6_41_15 TaxID=2014249 RepID=A0A2M7W3A0_9BACT|nr:MAG: hypothetical protein COZ14_00895 [Candidatus Dojkabacteria bacterium CG_4_10_14_3_um_filter_Dojkabacteria_WS6_41_9]PJA14822.1 MAG: hypothetical protein COX64_01540 [Candidatus Dojkabacteria bacterium CG_4_10_14_0_2_um_filter_Dojkabacteria_WS6_41_15]PJB23882.1 MAG: hypothetical protein CO112_00310 [Candidatus Dojkabacteria bacterium CG_4_9_14_3_um_filter_150_Dojkabacteria_WS6_41_13]
MQNIALSDDYFNKFSEKPVAILPFKPKLAKLRKICEEFLIGLNARLQEIGIVAELDGSLLYKIAGKEDLEVVIYAEGKWYETLQFLINMYHKIDTLEEEYARINVSFKGYEIEVKCKRGPTAETAQKLREYFTTHSETLAEYEKMKLENCYSKRVYQKQKHLFLSKVLKKL